VPRDVLEEYVRSAPTGTQTCRAWFFYETLTGQILDVEDAPNVTAVDALDTRAYFTGKARLSKRHRVRDNLLGTGDCCPILRRTTPLQEFAALGLAQNLIMLIRQNNGTLSKKRRNNKFSKLANDEVQSLERIIQDIVEGFDDPATQG